MNKEKPTILYKVLHFLKSLLFILNKISTSITLLFGERFILLIHLTFTNPSLSLRFILQFAMGTASTGGGDVEAGFAKLQGEDFEYYMQTYSIILGRNSKKSTVDVDLSSLGGGMNISRHHARIFYDFTRRRFALEVLGKNGCLVEGVLHLPGNPPVKLDSQDLLQIGDKEFYFLLPVRSILGGGGSVGTRHYANHHSSAIAPPAPSPALPPPVQPHYGYGHPAGSGGAMVKKGRREYYEEEYEMDDDVDVDVGGGGGSSGKKVNRREAYDGYGYGGGVGSGGKASLPGPIG